MCALQDELPPVLQNEPAARSAAQFRRRSS